MGASGSTPDKERIVSDGDKLRNRLLLSDRFIKNRPWIFDLEQQIINQKNLSFETDEEYVKHIFNELSDSSNPFWVFQVPFQQSFKDSKYPIDLIVGLYSQENLDIQLFVADVFMGRYSLTPFVPLPLHRFIVRFFFYGYNHNCDNLIRIKCQSRVAESKVRLICCVLDNVERKECVLNSFINENSVP